jgi:hypothetical protein
VVSAEQRVHELCRRLSYADRPASYAGRGEPVGAAAALSGEDRGPARFVHRNLLRLGAAIGYRIAGDQEPDRRHSDLHAVVRSERIPRARCAEWITALRRSTLSSGREDVLPPALEERVVAGAELLDERVSQRAE